MIVNVFKKSCFNKSIVARLFSYSFYELIKMQKSVNICKTDYQFQSTMHTIICFYPYAWAGHNTDTEARPASCEKRTFSQSSNRGIFLPNYFLLSLRHTESQGLQGGALSISKALSHLPSSAHTQSFQITVDKPEGVSSSWTFSHTIFIHTQEDY